MAVGRREKSNQSSIRGSRILAAIGVGILVGCVFAFLFPHGFFSSIQPSQIRTASNSNLEVTIFSVLFSRISYFLPLISMEHTCFSCCYTCLCITRFLYADGMFLNLIMDVLIALVCSVYYLLSCDFGFYRLVEVDFLCFCWFASFHLYVLIVAREGERERERSDEGFLILILFADLPFWEASLLKLG